MRDGHDKMGGKKVILRISVSATRWLAPRLVELITGHARAECEFHRVAGGSRHSPAFQLASAPRFGRGGLSRARSNLGGGPIRAPLAWKSHDGARCVPGEISCRLGL